MWSIHWQLIGIPGQDHCRNHYGIALRKNNDAFLSALLYHYL